MPDPTYIAGTAKQNGVGRVGRLVSAFGFDPDTTLNTRLLLGQAATAADGSFEIEMEGGPTELAIVVAFDDAGLPWAASTALALSARVYQVPFDGVLYEVTVAGDSGASEPDWAALAAGEGGAIGTATTTKVIYQQPLASGPVLPSAIGV